MVRMQITLSPAEADSLTKWAKAELRDPRDQIRFIVREALQNEKFLPAEANKPEKKGDPK